MPPSIHPNDDRYRWLEEFAPHEIKPAFAPVWLLQIVTAEHRPVVTPVSIPKMRGPRANYAHTALVNVLGDIINAVEGARNQTFFNAACRLLELHKAGLYPDYDAMLKQIIAAGTAARKPLLPKEMGASLYSAERRILGGEHSYERKRRLIDWAGRDHRKAVEGLLEEMGAS